MKIYHVDRDFSKTLSQQKKEIEKQYTNFQYLWSDGRKIHFMAD